MVKEKIIFFVDVDEYIDKKINGSTTRLDAIKKALLILLSTKAKITNDTTHEFAVAACTEEAILFSGFSSNIQELGKYIQNMHSVKSFTKFEASSMFKLINSITHMPKKNEKTGKYTFHLRIILIYARNITPIWGKDEKDIKEIIQQPYFFFDLIYFDNKQLEKENIGKDRMFEWMVNVTRPNDVSEKSYIFKIPFIESSSVVESVVYEYFAYLVGNTEERKDQNKQICTLDSSTLSKRDKRKSL